MNIQVPEKVNTIIETLLQHGFEAYAVGGCVRDSLLNREADDWDITTSASPYEVKELFRRTIDTGIQHGTVTVMLDKEGFEVTTYRIDGEYEDGRHPKEVLFTKNLEEDLKRRDFTINAMAYNEQTGMVDIFGGVKDLENKIIRCVGVAGDRFDEDALRIMRAFRFSAQLGFSIEENTRIAAAERAENLKKISAERVRVELTKLLLSAHPDRLLWMQKNGVIKIVLPEFDAMLARKLQENNYEYNAGEYTVRVIEQIGTEGTWSKKELQMLRFAALLHRVAKPEVQVTDGQSEPCFSNCGEPGAKKAKGIMQRLKFDNETTDMVVRLVAAHDNSMELSASQEKNLAAMRHLMHGLGPDMMELLFELQRAKIVAGNPEMIESKLAVLAEIKALHKEVVTKGDCVSLKQLAVNGKDIIGIGAAPGKHLGEILEQLLQQVLDNPDLNQKEILLSLAKEHII